MREILAREQSGDASARLALAVYCHRLRAGIATMASALGGLDLLVFTGGAGERSPALRRGAADGLEFLGVSIDDDRNLRACGDIDLELSAPGAACRVAVVRAREDLEMAGEARALLEGR